MQLIDNQSELDQICLELLREPEICVDTEFMRRVTYYSKLCLIQIVTSKHRCVIDPLASIDLTPFAKVLFNNKILKILHAPREDLEIFYRIFKGIPRNIFDTQIAASLCGLGDSISYGGLCSAVLGIDLDKKHQTGNWLKRPLSDNMLTYAIKDVDYLKPLYDYLNNKLIEKDLQAKFNRRLNVLRSPKSYTVDLNNIWKKVSFNIRSRNFLHKMQAIAALREECAMDANVPRRHFAADQDLVRICNYLPISYRELKTLKLSTYYFNALRYRTKLLEVCAALRLEKIDSVEAQKEEE